MKNIKSRTSPCYVTAIEITMKDERFWELLNNIFQVAFSEEFTVRNKTNYQF